MLSIPSLSRRRSSNCNRKPTANRLQCDYGKASDTSGYLLGFMGKVVFAIPKQPLLSSRKTLIMAIYCHVFLTGVVVFSHPDRGDSTGLLKGKLSSDFHLEEKGVKR